MSYIELPVAEYRRRLAALPRLVDADAGTARPGPAATDGEVLAARSRYPRAFLALDAEVGLTAGEIAERERLIVAAVDAVQGAPG